MNIKLQYVAILMAMFVSTLHCRPERAPISPRCDTVQSLPLGTNYAEVITCRVHKGRPEMSYEEVYEIVVKHFNAMDEEINNLYRKKMQK